ncbi:MAG: 4Fe-4S dicluster domain-containing protein [Proteobacteria bacterium]|jgi:coenzyme F420-reducing hydrogenase beta subunit|nr:4Fe-4S dicluster domain-containing protein [Pseudomonadota bacterium]
MTEVTKKIREVARKLLQKKKVDLVIGFEQGTLPLRATPCFVRREEEVDRLVWDSFCENNLAKYLAKMAGKVAIVAKGCDVRAAVELIKENQISREHVVIIGIPCQGMVDRRLVEAELQGREILEVGEKDNELIFKGGDFKETLDRDKFLYHSCKTCTHRNPVIYDVLVGDPVPELSTDPYQDVEQFEDQSAEERWEYFSREFGNCIRCYACRNACPLCYCHECFVDCSQPQWFGKTTDLSDTAMFHLMRAFHLAGRCVECGACERACPMGVDIRKLNRKLSKDVKDLFAYQAGISLEQVTPLATFKPDDNEEFILNP